MRIQHARTALEKLCAIVETIKQIGGSWRLIVIRHLMEGPMRFNELKRAAENVNSRTLSTTLKYLEERGIVARDVTTSPPIAVQYSLTKKGRELSGILEGMQRWGRKWIENTA